MALGAGLAGLAATSYFFFGPQGKANQKHAKAWAIKMKGDVIGKLEKAKAVSQPVYHKIIDTVASKHAKGKTVNAQDVKALAQDLKKHWGAMSTSAPVAKPATSKVKPKVVKK